MKINFIFLLGCMIACLLFLSCSVGDKSNSQVTEASALTSNVQENKSEQETKTAKEANSVQGNLGLELSQTHFTNKPQVVTLTITNNSPWTCIVGYEYFIEKENKDWKKIPLKNAAFIEIIIIFRIEVQIRDIRNIGELNFLFGIFFGDINKCQFLLQFLIRGATCNYK